MWNGKEMNCYHTKYIPNYLIMHNYLYLPVAHLINNLWYAHGFNITHHNLQRCNTFKKPITFFEKFFAIMF